MDNLKEKSLFCRIRRRNAPCHVQKIPFAQAGGDGKRQIRSIIEPDKYGVLVRIGLQIKCPRIPVDLNGLLFCGVRIDADCAALLHRHANKQN